MITDINHSKKELAETFFQRLVDSYGYLPEQMEFGVKVSPTSVADIAIWRSPDDKKSGLAPDIYVLVANTPSGSAERKVANSLCVYE